MTAVCTLKYSDLVFADFGIQIFSGGTFSCRRAVCISENCKAPVAACISTARGLLYILLFWLIFGRCPAYQLHNNKGDKPRGKYGSYVSRRKHYPHYSIEEKALAETVQMTAEQYHLADIHYNCHQSRDNGRQSPQDGKTQVEKREALKNGSIGGAEKYRR